MATLDTLRDKWDSITPRERKLVVLLGVAAVATIVAWLALQIGDRLAAMERQNAEMRKALDVLADYRMRGRPDAAAPGVEIGTEPVKLESYLDKAAQKVGINVPSYRPRGSQTRNGFVTHTVELSVGGLTIDQAKDFLEAIERDNRLVAITQLTIKRNFADTEKVDIQKMEVSTYARAGAAPDAGGAGGGNGGGGTPAGGSR